MIFSAGYRRDDLDWNIAGDAGGNNPNVLSELTWNDLQSFQVKFQGGLVIPNIIALRGYADYAWILDGENQDSDYLGDNRTYEFSRSNNNADDGNMWDASMGIGYPFRWGGSVISTITPLVGYSHHEQNLKMTDGHQTISVPVVTPTLTVTPPPVGPFSGLDNSYNTEWEGPWLGIDLTFRAAEIKSFAHRLATYFSYEYHWADYHAEANWNLREVFQHPKSFEHDADGTGWIVGTGFNFILQRHISLNFNFEYQNWSTDDGTDKTFYADGTTSKTRLNEVNWSSYALGLGLEVRF
ncbi:MAG: hypothetical protein P8X90_16740 [Desulfobacterales bacterium]